MAAFKLWTIEIIMSDKEYLSLLTISVCIYCWVGHKQEDIT